MTSTDNIKGIAARAAVWSARHRTLAILGWIAFVIGVTVLSGQIGTRESTGAQRGHGESARADAIVDQAGCPRTPATELVIVQNRSGTNRSVAVKELTAALRRAGLGSVAKLVVSPDGRSTLISFDVPGDPDTASDRVGPALDAVDAVQQQHHDLYIGESGSASGDKLIGDSLDSGLARLSVLSIPVTLGILLVAFGAVVAALLPVALAVTAVVAAIGLLAAASRLAPTVDTTMHSCCWW